MLATITLLPTLLAKTCYINAAEPSCSLFWMHMAIHMVIHMSIPMSLHISIHMTIHISTHMYIRMSTQRERRSTSGKESSPSIIRNKMAMQASPLSMPLSLTGWKK